MHCSASSISLSTEYWDPEWVVSGGVSSESLYSGEFRSKYWVKEWKLSSGFITELRSEYWDKELLMSSRVITEIKSDYWVSELVLSSGVIIEIKTSWVFFTRLESLARSQKGFWQPSFFRKRNLWSICYDGRTKVGFLFIAYTEKRKKWWHVTSSFFQDSLHFHFPPGKQCREATPYFLYQNKGFINHSFCRNLGLRSPTGTRLDSLAW